jgi:hypothetical protein
MDAALRVVDVQLNRETPDEWRYAFLNPPGPSRVLFELQVVRDVVTFTVESMDEVPATLAEIDARITSANRVCERSAHR